jgi:hypothetical protein
MDWIFVFLGLPVLAWLWARRRNRQDLGRVDLAPEPTSRRSAPPPGISFSLTTSFSSYDPAKYRFDGRARPEYRIVYSDESGVVSERDIYVHTWEERGPITYYEGWCFLRDERRTFRGDRILSITNLSTNRKIKDIARHRVRY